MRTFEVLGLSVLVALTALQVACTGVAWAPEGGGSTTSVSEARQRHSTRLVPVIFVPGVTGTKLRDPGSGRWVWGSTRNLLRPVDGGYGIVLPLALGSSPEGSARAGPTSPHDHPQARFEPLEPIWQLGLFGIHKPVDRPLVERFAEAGYRLGTLEEPATGGDLFFFNYDWRFGNIESVRRLDRQLTALAELRGSLEVDLVCQSNAARICRWLARFGDRGPEELEGGMDTARPYRIRKLVLVGASNNGALRVLEQLDRGRVYVPWIGRRLQPETLFSIRPLFEDLPVDRSDLFFDEHGEGVEVDLFDAASWLEYGWSIFSPEAEMRLGRRPRPDLFGTELDRLAYLQRQLDRSRRIQRLLASDAGLRPQPTIYLLENESASTIDGAVLVRERDGWRTLFVGDSRVDGDPLLHRLVSAPGDGHASLASQRGLSRRETEAIAGRATVAGGHFEAMVRPEALAAMLGFLADETAPSEASELGVGQSQQRDDPLLAPGRIGKGPGGAVDHRTEIGELGAHLVEGIGR